MLRAAEVLQKVERGPRRLRSPQRSRRPDNRFVREQIKSARDGWESVAEILSVARLDARRGSGVSLIVGRGLLALK